MKWITVVVLALVGCAETVSAQTAATDPWSRGTTLAIFGGTATAALNTTGTFGAAMGWELTHRAEPEAAVRLVTDDSRIYRVATVTLSLAYHVEAHAVDNE